jgi:hypothetical protein
MKNVFQTVFLFVVISELLILIITSWNNRKSSGKNTKSDRGSMLFIMFGYLLAILMNPICIHAFPLIMLLDWCCIDCSGRYSAGIFRMDIGEVFYLSGSGRLRAKNRTRRAISAAAPSGILRQHFITCRDCAVVPVTPGRCCDLADYRCCIWLSNQNGRKHIGNKLWFTVSGLRKAHMEGYPLSVVKFVLENC